MKDLLLLCPKNEYFPCDKSKGWCCNRSPLRPVIAGIFTVDLERNVIPKLSTYMTKKKRDEKDNKVSFLDVLILRNGYSMKTTVYWKLTHSLVSLYWDSFSPNSWKVRTLKALLWWAFVVCSNEQLLKKEIEHFQNLFHHTDIYSKALTGWKFLFLTLTIQIIKS